MRVPLHNYVFKMVLTSGKKLEPNQFIFVVPEELSKPQIKNYLETLYNVSVSTVNTVNVRGKVKRSVHGMYKKPNYKKAYVTINELSPASEKPL